MSKIRFFSILITISIIFSSCKSSDNSVPYALVNLTIYLSDPTYSDLNGIGNSVHIDESVHDGYNGYKGLIIFRKSFDEFTIYDKCCTYEPTKSCEIVERTESQYIVKCACCNTQFSLLDGYPFDGVAQFPLKQYNYTFDGNNTLSIYN